LWVILNIQRFSSPHKKKSRLDMPGQV